MAAVRLWIGSVFVHKTGAVASFEPPTLMVLMGRRVPHFLFDVGPLLSYRGQKSLGLYEALILLKSFLWDESVFVEICLQPVGHKIPIMC